MANTSVSAFERTTQKTHQLLREIGKQLGWQEREHQAYSFLRVFLHTLRDRLTVEEAAQFASEMPMLLRGLYYEGWKPSVVPKKMNKEQFIHTIQTQVNFSFEMGIEEAIQRLWSVLRRHMSSGEATDIEMMMPKELTAFLRGIHT